VYVEMVGSRIDSTFASLPPMVRSNGNESIKTKICSRMLSFVYRQTFQEFGLRRIGFRQNKQEKRKYIEKKLLFSKYSYILPLLRHASVGFRTIRAMLVYNIFAKGLDSNFYNWTL